MDIIDGAIDSKTRTSRVVLIDDSNFVLEGLQALSKSSRILVAGTARTEDEAVVLLKTCQPDGSSWMFEAERRHHLWGHP